jgi:hypothetical protein
MRTKAESRINCFIISVSLIKCIVPGLCMFLYPQIIKMVRFIPGHSGLDEHEMGYAMQNGRQPYSECRLMLPSTPAISVFYE